MSVRIYFYTSLMAIQQLKRQSDLEKRLKLLHQQVYGRESVAGSKQYVAHTTNYLPTTNYSSDITYLHQDLLKILLLATFAIGAQIILFILVQLHVLRINFF